ncbi:MAG: ABC transporter substrate-binding protein [Cyclobacteriaceae bacterium]|nr:ABC transporter substrate-binding protein [Cyclobacteriaceae bacterium HetDA_MAG_MS6]
MKMYLKIALASCAIVFFSCEKRGSENTNTKEKKDFKGATLNILCWEGYADEQFTKSFEEEFGVKVKGTYFGSSDELVSKLQSGGGSSYDIVSPSSDVAGYLVKAGLVDPVDPSKISGWDNLSPLLKNMQDVVKDGQVYGMPFTWGPDYLVYNADVIQDEPTSWDIFFDPQYRGKVAIWDDISNIYLMGQVLGMDKEDPSVLYNMTEDQLALAKAKLIDLKPQLRKYWATAGELDNLFKNGEVVMAVGWPITPATLNRQGMNIKSTIPKEGATGWIDRLMIVKGSENAELAQLWLDYISKPQNMAKVAEVTTYSIANPNAAKHMSEELQKLTYINDMDYYHENLNFWQPVPNRKRYNEVWSEVKNAN